VLICNQRFH